MDSVHDKSVERKIMSKAWTPEEILYLQETADERDAWEQSLYDGESWYYWQELEQQKLDHVTELRKDRETE